MSQASEQHRYPSTLSFIVLILSVIAIWLSLILQFCISIPAYIKNGWSLVGVLVQLFSFFTIQSNLLAGLGLSALLLNRSTTVYKFFSRGYVLTGIVLYVAVVGLVYNIILRSLWHPEDLFKLADELLHSINPILFFVCWLIFSPKEKLKWAQSLNWLWFPFLYLIYTLIRGAATNFYPYPFIDAGKLGYFTIAINSLVLLVVFLALGLLLILLTRALSKQNKA